jgi:hypothetical protein
MEFSFCGVMLDDVFMVLILCVCLYAFAEVSAYSDIFLDLLYDFNQVVWYVNA